MSLEIDWLSLEFDIVLLDIESRPLDIDWGALDFNGSPLEVQRLLLEVVIEYINGGFMKKVVGFWTRMGRRSSRRKDSKRPDAGFSFVETLAVLAVTALLASQAGAAAFNMVQKARVSAARTQIESFKAAIQSYYIDCGAFPTGEQGLSALWEKPEMYPVPEGWNGPYVERRIPLDPWGNAYVYRRAGEVMPDGAPDGVPFVVLSLGADGELGGEKNALDIVSWE